MSTLDLLRETMNRIIHVNENEINPDTPFKDIKADSLDWVQIIVGIESTLDIEIDIDKMKEMVTIGDFVNYIDNFNK